MAGDVDAILAKYGASAAPAAPAAAAAEPAGDIDAILTKYSAAPRAAAQPEQQPGLIDRIGSGLATVGGIAKEGLRDVERHVGRALGVKEPDLAASFGAEPSPAERTSRRREFERGVDDIATLGYGQKLAARAGNALGDKPGEALGPETFGGGVAGAGGAPVANSQAPDLAAAPGYRTVGRAVGMALPGATSALTRGGGAAVNLATRGVKAATLPGALALGALKGGAAYELTAPVQAGLSADAEGHRLETARDVATDPEGLALAAGSGALAGGFEQRARTAPARVAERQAEDITTGGDTNAKAKTTRKVQERAGEGGAALAETLARDPELEKLVAVKAGTSPGKVGKAVTAKLGRISDELDDVYAKMDKAGRVVAPADIAREFDKMVGDRLTVGDIDGVNVLRRARGQFVDEYGKYGKLSAETMRGLKRTAARAAFAGDPTAPASLKAQVSRDVWDVYSRAIERQAENAEGVDIGRLRQLNKDASILIPAETALNERAAMADAGRKSIGEHLAHGVSSAGGLAGLATGHLGGAAAALAAPAAVRLGKQAVRLSDYALAKGLGGVAPDVSAAAGAGVGKAQAGTRERALDALAAAATNGDSRALSLLQRVAPARAAQVGAGGAP